MSVPRKAGRFAAGVLLACLLVLLVGACGDDDDSSDATAAGGGGEAVDYEAELDRLYEGTYEKPTGPDIKPEAGKNVWDISLGQNAEAMVAQTSEIKEAGAALGWDVTVFDGQFDPNRMLEGVNQALADGADGIILTYIDCAAVKPGLERAERAGVPVVAAEGSDCNEVQPGDPQLFDWVVHYGDLSFREWIHEWARAQATWVVAETDGQANALLMVQTDTETTKLGAEGEISKLEECPDCSYTEVKLVGADIGPALQQKVEQALLENPDANAFIAGYDALLTAGPAQALKASGRVDDMAIMGGEGSTGGVQLIYEGVQDACVGIPPGWEGYAAVDALIRLFAGRDPGEANSGIGIQVCDREHNLPPEGEAYASPFDYAEAYRGIWGLD